MNAEERIIMMLDIQDRANIVAINFAGKTISSGDGTYDLLRYDVANAIRETVAAAIEAEREACAQLMDKQAKGFQVLIDHAPTPIRAEDMKRVKFTLEEQACLIRARSEGEKKEKAGQP